MVLLMNFLKNVMRSLPRPGTSVKPRLWINRFLFSAEKKNGPCQNPFSKSHGSYLEKNRAGSAQPMNADPVARPSRANAGQPSASLSSREFRPGGLAPLSGGNPLDDGVPMDSRPPTAAPHRLHRPVSERTTLQIAIQWTARQTSLRSRRPDSRQSVRSQPSIPQPGIFSNPQGRQTESTRFNERWLKLSRIREPRQGPDRLS